MSWPEKTRFLSYLASLTDTEIQTSYHLSPDNLAQAAVAGKEDLVRILAVTDRMLHKAYRICSDLSPDRKMTQQHANILNEFYSSTSGQSKGFRYKKNPSTTEYFRVWKQLLVYLSLSGLI